MNIILFTQDDPFYVKVFFEEFFNFYKPLKDIKAVIISQAMGKRSLTKLIKQMYNFYGAKNFVIIGVKYLLTKFNSVKMLGRKIRYPRGLFTIKQICEYYGVNVIKRNDLNSLKFIENIKLLKPDLFISVASPIIFKPDLIKTPKTDCINIHSGPLPNYRGMLPNFWQMLNNEKQAGITIHRIDVGIDTGDIILQDFIEIDLEDSLDSLIRKSKKKGAIMMIEVINKFKTNEIKYQKMQKSGSYFTFPGKEDVKSFRKMGKRLL